MKRSLVLILIFTTLCFSTVSAHWQDDPRKADLASASFAIYYGDCDNSSESRLVRVVKLYDYDMSYDELLYEIQKYIPARMNRSSTQLQADAHTHVWSITDSIRTHEAPSSGSYCTTSTVKFYKCNSCGDTKREVTNKGGHTVGSNVCRLWNPPL